jgi:hypothetical protein
MAFESWIVTNRAGERIGVVRKLVLDSRTGRVTHAEVALLPSDVVVRMPWNVLELGRDGLILESMEQLATFSCVLKGGPASAPNVC